MARDLPLQTQTQLGDALPLIKLRLDRERPGIFSWSDLQELIKENRESWGVSRRVSVNAFINYLLDHSQLEASKLNFPSRTEVRYSWGKKSLYALLMNLYQNAYLSHYTALHLHQLTEQEPKSIYVNREQSKKRTGDRMLIQDRIDAAFKRSVRQSNQVAQCMDRRIHLLNGKWTGNLGVVELPSDEGTVIRTTGIERTLIDIAVRPEYSGGVFEVLKAYRQSSGLFSVNRLVAYLRRIDYIYPYHQVIGYYLEKSELYPNDQIEMLRQFPIKYEFYLTHGMREVEFSEKWQLYFPKGM